MTTAPQFYRVRLVKNGPAAGLKIWHGFGKDPLTGEEIERTWIWRCELNGREVPINDVIPWWGDPTNSNCVPGEPIAEIDYRLYAARHDWARTYDPTAPDAHPRKPVDMNRIAPIPWE